MPRTHTSSQRPSLSRSSLSYFFPALFAIFVVSAVVVQVDFDKRQQHQLAERVEASQNLAATAARLDTKINSNVMLVQGLAAAVSAQPDLTGADFSRLAERVFDAGSQLRNIAAAPGLVVRYVYPEAGNQRTIGLDYRRNDAQRDAALKVKETGKLLLTGPVNLVQGGTGLIARYPIFNDTGSGRKFWGLLSAVIDLQKLYSDSGLHRDATLDVAISRGRSDGEVFFGDPSLPLGNPVTVTIDLGYDTWTLSAVPKGGWTAAPEGMLQFRLLCLIIALCVVAPLFLAGFLMRQRQKNIATLQQSEETLEILSQRLELALEASGIGVWEYDSSTDVLIWDDRMRELYDVPADKTKCEYSDWKKALHPNDLEEAEKIFASSLRERKSYITQFRVVCADGSVRHIRAHGAAHRTATGGTKIVGVNWNVTGDVVLQAQLRDARIRAERQKEALVQARDKLSYQSLHDALTGLPNRRYLDQFMSQDTSSRPEERVAFVHIDLDHFKEINDSFGHAAGDEVLKTAAARLSAVIEEHEFVARIGGDEFVIASVAGDIEARCRMIAARVIETLGQPMKLSTQECRTGASVGIAIQKEEAESLEQLLINADIALYEAKKRGRSRVEYFTDELRCAVIANKRIADELIEALEKDQLVAYFQPQFDAHTLQVTGVEALARWIHPERGLLLPGAFLHVAEGLNRVSDIDSIILEKALFQMARCSANGLPVPKVSVNISAQRLKDGRMLEAVKNLAFPPSTVSFELLESISFENQDRELLETIHKLKKLGIDIEIDDFGTGHASIVSLLELAPKRLKIDRKLIAPIETSRSQRRLVSAIVEIGQSQGIEIVAEGVETLVQADILKRLGCQTLQGYAFARPMPGDALIAFLKDWKGNLPFEDAVPAGRTGHNKA